MSRSRVLFIGGTGIISSACVRAAIAVGHEVTVLNRGSTSIRPVPPGVETIEGDVRDHALVADVVRNRDFDVVADFMSFVPAHVEFQATLWRDRVGQYIFISSASAYQTPPDRLPIVESTPLHNPFWQYSRDKAACEAYLTSEFESRSFPATIVRPSHTYDRTLVPFDGGWTVIERMRRGDPIVVHGDGTSLWTLTHHGDFAGAFVNLFGQRAALGEAFHITTDEAYTWNQVAHLMGEAAGAAPLIVHVPSDVIAAADPVWGASLLGDKAHSMIFDNSKVKRLAPGWTATTGFAEGAREIVEWHDESPERRLPNADVEAVMDELVRRFAV